MGHTEQKDGHTKGSGKQLLEKFSHKKFVNSNIICTFATANRPDGGIGRRAGLKHQWGNPSRFEPGSGY